MFNPTTNYTKIATNEGAEAPRQKKTWRVMAVTMTPQLFACCFITALLNMLFGFDISSFAGV